MSAPNLPPDDRVRLQIGDWCLDPLIHQLQRGDERRRLPKRLVRLLQALAASPQVTLTREALLAAAWQRRVVGDEVLSRAIAELRQALDDDARAPRYIETLPKTGYRLLAPVRVLDPPDTSALHGAEATANTAGAPASDSAPASAPVPPQPPARPRGPAGWLIAVLLLAGAVAAWQWQQPAPRWTPAALAAEQPFLSPPEWVRQPRFSADARWLVYVLEAPDTRQTRVAYAPADGGVARILALGPGRLSGPALAPDGRRLAVLARARERCELRLLTLPEGPLQTLAECSLDHGNALEWSADGGVIYTAPAAAAGEGAGLWRIDPADGSRRQLTHPAAAQIADSQPRLAADGRLAFLRGPLQAQRLWLRDPAGGERRLIDSADRVPGLAWSADGRQLLVASNAGGFPALRAVDPDSGAQQLLGGRGAATLDIASDGRLIYEQRRYDANLWLYRPGAVRRRLTDSTRYDAYPALAPDGKQLVYVSNRDGSSSVWVLPLSGAGERRLRLPPANAWVRPNWRSDGRSLWLTRYDDRHRTEPFQYELATDLLQPLPIDGGEAFGVRELGEGQRLFGRNQVAGLQLWLQAPDGAPSALAAAREVDEFRSDGAWLGWQQRGLTGVFLLRREALAAPPQRYLAGLPPGQPLAWTLAAEHLVYLASGPDDALWLWRQPLPAGEPSPWLAVAASPADSQLAVAADFAFAVLSHVDQLQSELLQVPAPSH